jgi:hypothetical protein
MGCGLRLLLPPSCLRILMTPPDEIDGVEIRFREGMPEIVFIVDEP